MRGINYMYLHRLYFGENGKFQLPKRKNVQKPHPDIAVGNCINIDAWNPNHGLKNHSRVSLITKKIRPKFAPMF